MHNRLLSILDSCTGVRLTIKRGQKVFLTKPDVDFKLAVSLLLRQVLLEASVLSLALRGLRWVPFPAWADGVGLH